jgi:hypothetical protein
MFGNGHIQGRELSLDALTPLPRLGFVSQEIVKIWERAFALQPDDNRLPRPRLRSVEGSIDALQAIADVLLLWFRIRQAGP